MCGQSCSCSPQSNTCARRIASARFSEDMSQPGGYPQARPGPKLRPRLPPHPRPRAPPTVEHEVVGRHHGQQRTEGHEHFLALGVQAQANSAGLRQRAVVVGLLGGGSGSGVKGGRGVGRASSRPGPRLAPESSALLLGTSPRSSKPRRKPLRSGGPTLKPSHTLGSAPERPLRNPRPPWKPRPESARSQKSRPLWAHSSVGAPPPPQGFQRSPLSDRAPPDPPHLAAGARGPGQAQSVGQHRSGQRGAVVAAPADEHDPEPGHLPGGPESEARGRGVHLGAGSRVSRGPQAPPRSLLLGRGSQTLGSPRSLPAP